MSIATLNSVAYIERCLSALLSQPAQQVLVIDGGSRDGTIELIEAWQRRHPQLELDIYRERGLARARNRAVALCREEVILFIDSDAEAHPELLSRVADRYARDPALTALGGRGIEQIVTRWDRLRALQYSQDWGPAGISGVPFLFGLCSSYRADALRSVGLFSEEFLSSGEDVEVGLKLRLAGHTLVYDPELMVTHFRRDNARTLLQMVERWSYYGHRAQLLHRQFGTSRWRARLKLLKCLLIIPFRETRQRLTMRDRLMLTPFFLREALSIFQAERDHALAGNL